MRVLHTPPAWLRDILVHSSRLVVVVQDLVLLACIHILRTAPCRGCTESSVIDLTCRQHGPHTKIHLEATDLRWAASIGVLEDLVCISGARPAEAIRRGKKSSAPVIGRPTCLISRCIL
nr:hypothetical protein CFP56_57045 [Quercus suber]